MSTQTTLIIILVTALAGCDQSNQAQDTDKNPVAKAVSNSEQIIDSNVESIKQNYKQQAYDALPPKRQD